MNKALIFSDIHIHPHKRSVDRLGDCLLTLDWIFTLAANEEIHTIFFVGDLFHDRQKIDVLTYQRTFDVFKKHLTERDIKIALLLGNHDLWHAQKWDVSSVFPLAALPGVEVIDRPCSYSGEYFDLPDKQIGFLPYTHDPIMDMRDIGGGDVLFAHVAVDDAVWNVRHGVRSEVAVEHDGNMVKVGTDTFKEWGRTFLGHYHCAQKLSPYVEYVGSPLQLSFGEALEKKYAIIYDFENDESEYYLNDFSPQHLIIYAKDIPKHDLTGNFVKIIVDDIAATDLIDLRDDLTSKYNPRSLEIIQNTQEKKQHIVEDAKAILLRQEEMLEHYVDQVGTDGLDRAELLKIGHSIIEECEK
tara:strand:- start:151 stop:1218 length:1068 start_codon:yes stop_codon:yes gene_type:complete